MTALPTFALVEATDGEATEGSAQASVPAPGPVRALRPVHIQPVPDRDPEPLAGPLAGAGPIESPPTLQVCVQPHLELVPTGAQARRPTRRRGESRDAFAPRPTATHDLPDPTVWAGQLALGAMHVISGVRSPRQLARFVTPAVNESLNRRRVGRTRGSALPVRPARVRRVLISEPGDGIADASVVVDDGARVRAVDMRLIGVDGRWLVTELIIG